MSSFAEGMRIGQGLVDAQQAREQRDKENARNERLDAQRAESHASEMRFRDIQAGGLQRQNRIEAAGDAAFLRLNDLRANGAIESNTTGLPASAVDVATSGATGYGAGAAGLQAMAGDYARENNRFNQSLPEGAARLPAINSAGVTTRTARESDIARALTGISMAKQDQAGITTGLANEKLVVGNEILNKGRTDWRAMTPDQQVAAMVGITRSDAHPIIMMPSIDPKTGAAILDKKSGRPMMVAATSGGQQFQLTPDEQADMYAAHQLTGHDADRASKMIATGTATQRALHAAQVSEMDKQAERANQSLTADATMRGAAAHEASAKAQAAYYAANVPKDFSPATQAALKVIGEKIALAKTPDEHNQLVSQWNATQGLEQRMGRGGHLPPMPYYPKDSKPEIPFADFMNAAGGSPVTHPQTGAATTLGKLPIAAQIAAWRTANGSGGAAPGGLPTTGGPEAKGTNAAPAQGSGTPTRIPAPPSRLGFNFDTNAVNPSYQQWHKNYSLDAYAAQHASDLEDSDASEAAMKRRFLENKRSTTGLPPPRGN